MERGWLAGWSSFREGFWFRCLLDSLVFGWGWANLCVLFLQLSSSSSCTATQVSKGKLRSRFNRELFYIVKAPSRRRWILTSLFINRDGHSNLPWPPSPSLPTSPPSSSSCCKASQTPDTETAADQTDYHPSHTAPDADSASAPSSYAG